MPEKKKRQITPSGFLSRLSRSKEKNKSAQGFLDSHREFLLNGTLAEITTPIVVKSDSGEIDPDQAMESLFLAVDEFVREAEFQKFVRFQDKVKRGKKQNMSPVIATIYDQNGNPAVMKNANGEEMSAEKGFDLGQDAERWVDRRLVLDAPSGSYGEIVHQRVLLGGKKMTDRVSREDAFYRLHGEKKSGPIMKRTPKSISRLTSLMRVKESRSTFSGA